MKRTLVLMVVLALSALLVFGCTRGGNNYQTGYAAYGQPSYQGGAGQQGYIGGGCGVAGPEPTNADVSEPSPAA